MENEIKEHAFFFCLTNPESNYNMPIQDREKQQFWAIPINFIIQRIKGRGKMR